MRLRYIYSACTVIETSDLTIVSDPWFTPGIYDGSWFQYPPLQDPIKAIGPADIVYISHIHPDHYDPVFLRQYLNAYPQAKLLIGETKPNYLLNKMRIDGFSPEVISSYRKGETECFILPNNGYEDDNIDTALVVRNAVHSIVNMNDNPYDAEQVEKIITLLPNGKATIALLPYSGAGPYPQTYQMDEAQLLAKSEYKKQQFLTAFSKYIEALNPDRAIPFAGKYWLGGPLSKLNNVRGIADATEVIKLHPEKVIVLADGGEALLDTATLKASATRKKPYEINDVNRFLDALDFKGYDYEREISPLAHHNLPLVPLIAAAYRNAFSKMSLPEDYWLCIKCPQHSDYIVVNLGKDEGVKRMSDCSELKPRSEIMIDNRYLYGLLTRLYHWNNAEIGSQYNCLRVPDIYNPKVQIFLNKFQV